MLEVDGTSSGWTVNPATHSPHQRPGGTFSGGDGGIPDTFVLNKPGTPQSTGPQPGHDLRSVDL
jgi:hypothetical protein